MIQNASARCGGASAATAALRQFVAHEIDDYGAHDVTRVAQKVLAIFDAQLTGAGRHMSHRTRT
jgi:hypothetical protein